MATLIGFICSVELAASAAGVAECIDCSCAEAENDNCYEEVAEVGESLLPDLVAQTHCLECAPETVAEVKTEGYEPYDVDNYHPPVLECCVEEEVRILCVLTHELLELHLSPEVVQVECDETENDNSENKHILCCPRTSLSLVCNCITLSTTSLVVTVRKNECVSDVHDETERKYRDHDSYDRKCHEVASCLEETVSAAVGALECVDY